MYVRLEVQFLAEAAPICTVKPFNCVYREGWDAGCGCGQLQLGVEHWVTSVALLQVVDNLPNNNG